MNREEYIKRVFGSSGVIPQKIEEVDDAAIRRHRRFVSVLRALGGTAKRNEVTRGGPLLAREIDAIAAVLEGEGLLKIEHVQTLGRPATVYHMVEQ
jgi:hypothetical protein